MQSEEIRNRFLRFFERRGHAIIPSASLVPENDPSVLFTTAGMHPLVPYLLGEPHPGGKRLVNVQKCVRTGDLDDIGDMRHFSFFEMLGNWSLGDYFKEDAIKWSYEFLTDSKEGLGLDPKRLYVTCFEGDENAPRDEESPKIWSSLGIPESRIYFLGAEDNWWSPGPNGPSGPDSEMFYDMTEHGVGELSKEEFLNAVQNESLIEVWNDVFMEYEKRAGKVVGKLSQQNVDTGAGLERLTAVMQGKKTAYETDLFAPMMSKINAHASADNERAKRIVADHIRASVFMAADGVIPSNTDRGYVLRRLIRRAVRYAKELNIDKGGLLEIADAVLVKYGNIYDFLGKKSDIVSVIKTEVDRFENAIAEGLKVTEKVFRDKVPIAGEKFMSLMSHKDKDELLARAYENRRENKQFGIQELLITEEEIEGATISGADAFNLYQSFGLPKETVIDLAREKNLLVDSRDYDRESKKHQELSRAGAEQKFKGGLADTDEQSVKYHTATHLLHKALREVLGDGVFQKGSNITPERLRFDFSFERKMTYEEKKKVEDLVNEKISAGLPVAYSDLPLEEAKKLGAIGLFEEKYGDTVRVYKIGDFSLEFCGGPHVKNTGELGHFKIIKEESVSQGVRRIKATLG